jgi:F0F1-type ATP synthase membrane subunit b/b'
VKTENTELNDIFDEIEHLKEKRSRYKGKLDSLMDMLNEAGHESEEEAKKELEEMKAKYKRMVNTYNKKVKIFLEKYKDELSSL